MKKFLIYLCVIIVAVSTGFAVFYLVRDNEVISLTTTSLYKDQGSKFELALNISDPHSYTTISLDSSNDEVLEITDKEINVKKEIAKGSFVAKAGGVSRVNFKTNNSKFRNLYCDVVVGDGSVNYPFHISTAQQLSQIGKVLLNEDGSKAENPYTLASSYELVSDIDLSLLDDPWTPIGMNGETPFTGTFEGNGYSINNLKIQNINAKNVGLFSSIGESGAVKNVKFLNAEVHTSANNENVGLIAGINNGVIERVEIKSVKLYNENTTANVGAVAGKNESITSVAKIDRVSAIVEISGKPQQTTPATKKLSVALNAETAPETSGETPAETPSETPEDKPEEKPVVTESYAKGHIGGLVGYNYGGTVLYSYVNGTVKLDATAEFGGLIYKNEYHAAFSGYTKNLGANVKDCYSAAKVVYTAEKPNVAGLIYLNTDAENTNVIWGNYYDASRVPAETVGVTGMTDEPFFVEGKDSNQLKTVDNVKSHKSYTLVLEHGIPTQKETGEIYWNVQVWKIDGSNEGYPVLNYAKQDIIDEDKLSSNIDLVTDATGLRTALSKLDATIMVNADIDLSDAEWVPVGSATSPFMGQFIVGINPATNKPYEIKGLKIQSNAYEYAGFFGVISNARVENLTIVNPSIDNAGDKHTNAGAIAGANGIKGKKVGGAIINCSVLGGVVNGRVTAGGIVGVNNGLLQNVKTFGNYEDDDVAVLSLSVANKSAGNVGGVAGINYGTINTTNDKDILAAEVKGCVLIEGANGSEIKAGGIAGYNEGVIDQTYVKINCSDEVRNYGIVVNSVSVAKAGGIAGESKGYISNAYVSVRIVTGSDKSNSYAGGVVGYLNVGNNNSTKLINVDNCTVYNSYISSYNVGGLVGYLSGSSQAKIVYDDNKFISSFYSERYTISDGYYTQPNLVANIASSSVQDNVDLQGTYTGGLVCELQRGFVTDCYSLATLRGTNNAGMVYDINYNKLTNTGGVITRCYVIAKFAGGSNNYSVTSSEVHSQNNMEKRTAGFIDNYYFANASKEGKEPKYFTKVISDVQNWFLKDKDHKVSRDRKITTLHEADVWNDFAVENVTTKQIPWVITNGSLPKLDVDIELQVIESQA